MTEIYIKARKNFFKFFSEFLYISLIAVDDTLLLTFISQFSVNKDFNQIEQKGPFISSTVITQVIKAETLCALGFSEKSGSAKQLKEGIDVYNNIVSTYGQNNDLLKATIYEKVSKIYKRKNESSVYIEYLEKAKNSYTDKYYKKFYTKIVDINVEIALSFYTSKCFNESIDYLEQAIGILLDNKDEMSLQMANIQKFLGMNYGKKNDFEEALNCYYKSLDIINILMLDKGEEAYYLYYLICLIFVKKQDYFVSLEYLKKAKGVLYLDKESPLKNKFLEFFAYYKKYLDFVDENISTWPLKLRGHKASILETCMII